MNRKKIMFVFLLATSSVLVTSDSDQLKKSTLAVFGTYAVLSLSDIVFPMKLSYCSDAFTCIGGLATVTALMTNNDVVSSMTIAGLIGSNVYARSQGKKSGLTVSSK